MHLSGDTHKGRSEKKMGMGGWRGLINRYYYKLVVSSLG